MSRYKNYFSAGLFLLLFMSLLPLVSSISYAEENTIIFNNQLKAGKDITISIEAGKEYLHKFVLVSFLPFLGKDTPPQMAFWLEDIDGNYLETIYVTRETATGSLADKDLSEYDIERLKSLLPYWGHKRGEMNEYGHYYPTTNKPVVDTVSSATPDSSFILSGKINNPGKKIYLLAEINNSTDWNEYYTKDALPGEENYNGGKLGSGQPSLIYRAELKLYQSNKEEMELVGHGSADGSTGLIYEDLSNITTAKEIIEKIIITY